MVKNIGVCRKGTIMVESINFQGMPSFVLAKKLKALKEDIQ